EHAKVPALLVLHRGGSVRVKHVPFVKNGFRDRFHGGEVHFSSASPAGITDSMSASQVGIECCILYWYKRSKTSLRRQSHALFGEYMSILARHVFTGSLNFASCCHEMGATRRVPSVSP